MPQALGSSGAHMGVGIALFLATVTFEVAEAVEIWVEATAPVRTRATTAARTMSFILDLSLKFCIYLLLVAMALAHAAGVGVVGSAHGSGHRAVLGNSDLRGGGGGGDLGGSNCTSENESDDGCANNELHFGLTPKVLYLFVVSCYGLSACRRRWGRRERTWEWASRCSWQQ